MSSFMEQICTKQSFVHEQCSFVEELFSHSVAIRDMEPYVSISKQIFGGECYE